VPLMKMPSSRSISVGGVLNINERSCMVMV
jgi:hypothetical protein